MIHEDWWSCETWTTLYEVEYENMTHAVVLTKNTASRRERRESLNPSFVTVVYTIAIRPSMLFTTTVPVTPFVDVVFVGLRVRKTITIRYDYT